MPGYSLLVGLHIACGLGGLAAVPIPLLARKGSPIHRAVGWVFVAAMVGAAVTGLAMSVLWVVAPLAVHPAPAGVDPAVQASQLRVYGAFLGYLAWLILSFAWSGVRALRFPRFGAAHPMDRLMALVLTGGGLLLLAGGLVQGSWLFSAYGALGAALGARNLVGLRHPDGDRRELHARAMAGTVIAATTAFLALGARRWVEVPEVLAPVVWLGPAVIGIPALRAFIARDRARHGL